MTNALESLEILHNNPFIFSPIFVPFYEHLGEKPMGILLSYLVLPFVLYPSSREYLKNANARSSIRTLIGKPNQRERLFGLDDRISEYWPLTNSTLQYMFDNDVLYLHDDLSISKLTDWPGDIRCLPDCITSAGRLGLIFSHFDVPSIYRMLGVKSL